MPNHFPPIFIEFIPSGILSTSFRRSPRDIYKDGPKFVSGRLKSGSLREITLQKSESPHRNVTWVRTR